MAKRKPTEAVNGSYAAVPHKLLDSNAFIGLSDNARSLLFAFFRQHNGLNNGHFQLTQKWMAKQGWPSSSLNRKARDELIERGLIIRTRLGGLNMGSDWYAVTWLPITDYCGLDISKDQFHPGAWQFCILPPTKKRNPPSKKNHEARAGNRRSPVPVAGIDGSPSAPVIGAKSPLLKQSTVPVVGNNVFTIPPVKNKSKRIVGRAGCSGK